MIKSAQKKKLFGFTLIELLIVIAILGILAAAVLVAINPAKRTQQARDAQRKNDIGSIATEVQAYYTTPGQGIYSPNGTDLCGANSGLTTLTTFGGLKTMPDDPLTGTNNRDYCYTTNGTQVEAAVWATLEEPTSDITDNDASTVWCWESSDNKAQERAEPGATNCDFVAN